MAVATRLLLIGMYNNIHNGRKNITSQSSSRCRVLQPTVLTRHDRLLPLINDRDVLSMLQTNLAEHQVYLSTVTAQTSHELMLANAKNAKLGARVLGLVAREEELAKSVEEELIAEGEERNKRNSRAEDDDRGDRMDIDGHDGNDGNGNDGKDTSNNSTSANLAASSYAARIRTVNEKLEALKQEKRIYKGIAIGLVVNSGVDWARDEKLRELLMDDDDDDDDDGEDDNDGDEESPI